MMKKPVRLFLGAVMVLGLFVAGTVHAGTRVNLKVVKDGVPQTGAKVVLYTSYGTETAVAGKDGQVTFDLRSGRGFWVEVDGERLARFYSLTEKSITVIDLAKVGKMEWPRRRS
jgi:hypothetical protein